MKICVEFLYREIDPETLKAKEAISQKVIILYNANFKDATEAMATLMQSVEPPFRNVGAKFTALEE